MEPISDAHLASLLRDVRHDGLYVLWTGHPYRKQEGSLRGRALTCIREVGSPVALLELLRRAARMDGESGYDPRVVRSGLRLHQGAKPCTYFLLERDATSGYRAAAEIPFASPRLVRIPAAGLVVDRHGRLALDLGIGRRI